MPMFDNETTVRIRNRWRSALRLRAVIPAAPPADAPTHRVVMLPGEGRITTLPANIWAAWLREHGDDELVRRGVVAEVAP
jgi:hypothetical protein